MSRFSTEWSILYPEDAHIFERGEEEVPEKDHYLMHPERICLEDMTTYSLYGPPDYLDCINAKVHGFDKCWVHLTRDQKREYMARKKELVKSHEDTTHDLALSIPLVLPSLESQTQEGFY